MVRTFIIAMIFTTGVWANDIYVDQSTSDNDNKAALETSKDNTATGSTYQQPKGGSTFEKSLIVPTDTQYCSVVAGCYVQE